MNIHVMQLSAKRCIYSLIALTALLCSQPSLADSMRCGDKLVYDGDTMYTVKTRCGDPDDAIHRTEIRTVSHEVSTPCEDRQSRAKCSRTVETSVEVVIDEWTYDFWQQSLYSIFAI